jgi:hypothetical protein
MKEHTLEYVKKCISNIKNRYSNVSIVKVWREHSRGKSLYSYDVQFSCKVHGHQKIKINQEKYRTSPQYVKEDVCQSCIKAKAASKTDEELIQSFQERIEQRYLKGKGLIVKVIQIKDNILYLDCPKHGKFQVERRKYRDNMNWTCGKCAKDYQSTKGFEEQHLKITTKLKELGLTLVPGQMYQGSYHKLEVVCPVHGKFYITPNSFQFQKYACIECAILNRADTRRRYTLPIINNILKGRNIQCIDYNRHIGQSATFKCKEGHIWTTQAWMVVTNKSGCTKCTNNNISKIEHRIFAWVSKHVKAVQSYRLSKTTSDHRKHHSLDIYIPARKVAFEINGWFWHSNAASKIFNVSTSKRIKWRHFEKTNACEKAGIQLIHLWDDLLENKKKQYSLLMLDALRLLPRVTKLQIKEIEEKKANDWFNKFHINGTIKADQYIGIFSKQKMIACLAITENKLIQFGRNASFNWKYINNLGIGQIILDRQYFSFYEADFFKNGFIRKELLPPKKRLIKNGHKAYDAGHVILQYVM